MFGLSTVGFLLYILYPLSIISISILVSRNKEVNAESYFFANRNIHWLVLGISFLTSCFFSPYIFGLVANKSSLLFGGVYGAISVVMLLILGWYLAPYYLKKKINTLPEYFEKRFNKNCKFLVSTLYIIYNIFIRQLLILAAGSIFITKITGIDAYSLILFFLIITGIYIIIGGLRAEIYVNILQVLLIVVGVVGISFWVFFQSEGVNSVTGKIASLSLPDTIINSEFALPRLIFGLPVIAFWFWCADQLMVQKVLSVRNTFFVRKAALVTIFLQIVPILLIIILTGIININFFRDTVQGEALSNWFFVSSSQTEMLRGVLIMVVAAILTASFANFFNSTSFLITFDFYKNFKPNVSDRKLVLVGRLTTLLLLLYSVILIPLSQGIDFITLIKLFKAFTYFVAMVSAVFLIGLLNQKINAISALVTLSIGTIVIIFKTSIEIFFYNYHFANSLLNWFGQSSASGLLEFSVFIFLFSILFLLVFNKFSWLQNAAHSYLKILKQILLWLKTGWRLHKKAFLILLGLIIIVAWSVLF